MKIPSAVASIVFIPVRRVAIPFLLCASLVLPLAAEDWCSWRGPNDNGISNETDWTVDWPQNGPKIAWTAEVGTGFSSCVVQAQRMLTIGHKEERDLVSCLNTEDGHTLWVFEYPAALEDRDFEGGPTSTPTIDAGRVFILSRAGGLYCLDLQTGSAVWQTQVAEEARIRIPGWGFSASPLVVGDRILLNVGESGVALDKSDGKLIWSSADRESGYATPVVMRDGGKTIAIFASGRSFTGVHIDSGEQLWSLRWLTSFGCNAADPIVHDGKMFLSSAYNRGAALFQFVDGNPIEVWKNKDMQNQLHSSVLFQEHVYGIDGDMENEPRLKCMEWSTGNVLWSEEELHPGGLAMADGKLLVLTAAGELVIAPASPNGFVEAARGQVLEGKCWTVPVLSGGRVYCRSVQGQVACVDLRR